MKKEVGNTIKSMEKSNQLKPYSHWQEIYCRRGKIRWDKHLQFQPYEVFLRKYFRGALATSVHYLPKTKNSRENFRGKFKTTKTAKVSPNESFPVYGSYLYMHHPVLATVITQS